MKISHLPRGLKELAMLRQEQCTDPTFGEKHDDVFDGFLWDGTPEKFEFWECVNEGHFEVFYGCKVVNVRLKART